MSTQDREEWFRVLNLKIRDFLENSSESALQEICDMLKELDNPSESKKILQEIFSTSKYDEIFSCVND